METRNRRERRDEQQQFESVSRSEVPRDRRGKHHDVVERILRELGDLRGKRALKIRRTALGTTRVEHIRAALSRASAKTKMALATKVDDEYFYVWRQD